ncbi:MAG: metalloregulator ArsR/SmtB family transcription factor [Planctomycetota bacterium]|nr:metalloregulator ArsR/SmtB family transcription factor [Planctomycetota bacterium]
MPPTPATPATPAAPAAPSSPRQAARKKAAIDRMLDPELFKALADPTRLKLLACVLKCGRGCSVTEVAACCSVDFSVVARHLSVLARAGLLSATKDGRTVWYAPRGDALAERFRRLADAIDEWTPAQCCTTTAKLKRTGPRGCC